MKRGWPVQSLFTVVVRHGKPQGGGWPISLTLGLYRTWPLLRKTGTTQWARARSGVCDTEVPHGAIFRVTVVRLAFAELPGVLGATVCIIFCGAERFGDDTRISYVYAAA